MFSYDFSLVSRSELATPLLISSEDGVIYQDPATVTLKWKPVSGATGFYVEEQYYDGSAWKKLKTANVDVCTYSDTSMSSHGQSRWRVTAMDSTGTYITSNPSDWRTVIFSATPSKKKLV